MCRHLPRKQRRQLRALQVRQIEAAQQRAERAALRDAAAEEGIPVNALIARIDADRIASAVPANLASTLRVWLYARKM